MGKVIPDPQLNKATVAKIQNNTFIERYDSFSDLKENYYHHTKVEKASFRYGSEMNFPMKLRPDTNRIWA